MAKNESSFRFRISLFSWIRRDRKRMFLMASAVHPKMIKIYIRWNGCICFYDELFSQAYFIGLFQFYRAFPDSNVQILRDDQLIYFYTLTHVFFHDFPWSNDVKIYLQFIMLSGVVMFQIGHCFKICLWTLMVRFILSAPRTVVSRLRSISCERRRTRASRNTSWVFLFVGVEKWVANVISNFSTT